MERQERNKYIIKVFTFLMQETIDINFTFPRGGIAMRTTSMCIESFENDLSHERMIDFCICQVYAISGFGKSYLPKWNVGHSFGQKAITRFFRNTRGKRYYEDKWLSGAGLSRQSILDRFKNKSNHPLAAFIYPEYEEITKMRMHNSEVGFYICQVSTLLWTPFSKACRSCKHQDRCKNITGKKYDELYRIRIEEYKKTKAI